LTDAAGGSTNNVLVRNGSGNAAWSSSLFVSNLSITSQRFVNGNTTLIASDYFVGVDARYGYHTITLPLPNTTDVIGGKTFVIKDMFGVMGSGSNNCLISGGPVPLEAGYSFIMNQNYQCIEIMLTDDSGQKKWIIKSNSKNT